MIRESLHEDINVTVTRELELHESWRDLTSKTLYKTDISFLNSRASVKPN